MFVFCKNMAIKISENIGKNLTSKYSQKFLDPAKQSPTDTLKTAWKKAIQKTAESTGDFVANKFADQIAKVFRSSQIIVQKQLKAKQKDQKIYIYL